MYTLSLVMNLSHLFSFFFLNQVYLCVDGLQSSGTLLHPGQSAGLNGVAVIGALSASPYVTD